jgi:GGDEF domain-containing protein
VSAPSSSAAAPSDFAASAPAGPAQALAIPSDWVSHTLRHLERWVAWSIALYTAWLAVFAFPGVPALWLFALYAGLVGKWAEARPARRQSEMSWRAIALIAGAYVLHTHTSTELGGPIGPFFFWLAVTCLFYAFMLKPVWGAGVVGAALIELAVSFTQAASLPSASDFMVHAGFLCIFSLLLGMRFGVEMRVPDETLEDGRIDASTSLYNMAGLSAHGDALLTACRRDKRPVSVAVFDCADLLEVRTIYGSRIARKLMQRTVAKLSKLCANQGVAARTGPAEFTVLLPGAGRDKALAAIARALGSPTRVELDAGDSEIVMVPGCRVEAIGPEVSCVAQVHQELRRELAQIERSEHRRRRYLQRERERHSHPMGLAAATSAARTGRGSRSQQASTLPVPLVIS